MSSWFQPSSSSFRRLLRLLLSLIAVGAGVLGVDAPSGPGPAPAVDVAPPTTVYVAPDGSDSGRGGRAEPFGTFSHALDVLGSEGGTVMARGGSYPRQRIVLRHRVDVTVRAYPGERPVLDATGLVPTDGSSGVVEIRGGRELTVQGLTITGYRTHSQKKGPVGIYVTGAPQRLTIAGNHVHHLGNDNSERGSFDINAHGIAVYGTNRHSPARDVRITGNTVDHLVLGASESVVVNGNVAGWRITRNHIHHNNNIGIDAIGYEPTIGGAARWTDVNRARQGLIAHNVVTDIVSRGNPAYWESPGWCNCADGIYVDGGREIAVRGNVVRRCDIGVEAASEWPRGGTEDIRIRGNAVTRSRYTGLAIGGYGPGRGEAHDIVATNNTLRGNNGLDDGSPEILLQFKVHDTRIVGNKVTATHRRYPLLVARVRRAGTAAQNGRVRLDHNDYGVPGAPSTALFSLAHKDFEGLRAWRTATGQDRHSRVHRR